MAEICFELNGTKKTFKDKKIAYTYLDSLSSRDIDTLETKYIKAKSYKNIENLYQLVFNTFSPKNGNIDYCGSCIICRKDTKFNDLTKRYSKFDCQECINKYKEEFKARMKAVHGREYFTQDPEAQKKMMNSRELHTEYKFKDRVFNSMSSFETDFLDFMFKILKCNQDDIIECPFHIPYVYQGGDRFYIPDFYIPSLNMVVEVKSSKSAYAERDKDIEYTKKLAGQKYMRERNGYYFYLLDKNYKEFLDFLRDVINKNID